MPGEIAGNSIQDESKECIDNNDDCSTSASHQSDRKSSNQREQDETEDSMDDREEFQKQHEVLFANVLKATGLDDSVVEIPAFKKWVHFLNPAVRLPEPSSKKPKLDVPNTEELSRKQSVGELITNAHEEHPSSSNSVSSDEIQNVVERKEMMAHNEVIMENADSTDADEMVPAESERVNELIDRTTTKEPPAPGLTPCVICGKHVATHQSINMTANEAIKALMAAVYCEQIRLEDAEAAVCTVRFKMCTVHHDDLHKWMCTAIGVKTANEVDAIPWTDLSGVLAVYRRLKGIRDAFENRNPSNTPVGAFKMAIKSYYRNYVPRKQGIVRPMKDIWRIVREDPANQSFRNVLHEDNIHLSPVDEQILFDSVRRKRFLNHAHTTKPASAASLTRVRSSPDDTHFEQQKERRTVGEAMRTVDAVYVEGYPKQRKRIMHICQQANPNLFPVRVVQPVLPRSDFPRMAKTVPEGYTSPQVPNYVKVEGKVYKTVMAPKSLLHRKLSGDEPSYQEMVDNEPDFYPPGEFPFSTPPIKTEEPEDVKPEKIPKVNYENCEVKQEVEEIEDTLEELPSNHVKSELDLEPLEIRQKTKQSTNCISIGGVMIDETTTLGSFLGS